MLFQAIICKAVCIPKPCVLHTKFFYFFGSPNSLLILIGTPINIY